MMNRDLHSKFRKALLNVPATAVVVGRTALMSGIPSHVVAGLSLGNRDLDYVLLRLEEATHLHERQYLPIAWTQSLLDNNTRLNILQHPIERQDAARDDIEEMVRKLENRRLGETEESCLLILIDNTIERVKGLTDENDLKKLKDAIDKELEKANNPSPNSSANATSQDSSDTPNSQPIQSAFSVATILHEISELFNNRYFVFIITLIIVEFGMLGHSRKIIIRRGMKLGGEICSFTQVNYIPPNLVPASRV